MIKFVTLREDLREKNSSLITSEYLIKGEIVLFVQHSPEVGRWIVNRTIQHMLDRGCFEDCWSTWGSGDLRSPYDVNIYEIEEEEEEIDDPLPFPKGENYIKYKVVFAAQHADPWCPDPLEYHLSFHLSMVGDLIEMGDETFKVCWSRWL